MKLPPLQNRAAILLFFLFLWAALVAAHLFFYTTIARDEYIKRGNAIAMREGILPAKRGNIFDKDGIKLAWTEQFIDLYVYERPEDPFYRNRIEKNIKNYFPNFSFLNFDGKRCIRKNLSPIEQAQLFDLIKKFPEINFKVRKERKYKTAAIGKYLQKIGIEQSTQGKKGNFIVMADRNGKWIPGTWDEKIKPLNGNDITIELTLKELKKEAEADENQVNGKPWKK